MARSEVSIGFVALEGAANPFTPHPRPFLLSRLLQLRIPSSKIPTSDNYEGMKLVSPVSLTSYAHDSPNDAGFAFETSKP